MKQIPILSGKAMIVELKHKPIYMEIIHSGDLKYEYEESETGPQKYTYVNLPPGTWQIVGMLSEVTKEQTKQIFHTQFIEKVGYTRYFLSSKVLGNWFNSVNDAIEGAIKLEGWYFENPYGKDEPVVDDPDPHSQYYGAQQDELARWQQAQSRVLCRERCLVLRRVD